MITTIGAEWGVFADADVGDASLAQNNLDGKDYARYTPNVLTRLTDTPDAGVALPADAVHMRIQVLNNPISYRIGSTDATAAEGFIFFADTQDDWFNARAVLENISFIDTSAGASEVRILYGRAPA